jgi:hypothetical protein
MSDPSSLSTVETAVLSEGVKFLYGQAGELLRRWRERREKPELDAADAAPVEGTTNGDQSGVPAELPDQFTPTPVRPRLDQRALDQLAGELAALAEELPKYTGQAGSVDIKDPAVLGLADALRRCMEIIWRRPLVFRGEQRESDIQQALVEGRLHAADVAGYAAAVRATVLHGSAIRGQATAERVAAGGQLVGVDIDAIGPWPRLQPPPPPE